MINRVASVRAHLLSKAKTAGQGFSLAFIGVCHPNPSYRRRQRIETCAARVDE